LGLEGLSETTGASADFYCHSNNDNHIRTSCTFYVKSMQVEHSREIGGTERERERGRNIVDWGERERTYIEGERTAWVRNRGQLFCF
jgi:hypothetical protein